jgi:phosphatidylglycerophosphate synthase
MSLSGESARRPVAARGSAWAIAIAGYLARRRVRPNAISLASLGAAIAAGACLLVAGRIVVIAGVGLLVLAAAFIQLRLLCNLLDGMVAIEGGLASKTGGVFNELPDRVSDVIVLVCAGYVAGGPAQMPALGWCAAVLALLTAYVRALAGSLGATQDFGGPMAKQARMQTVSAACLLSAVLLPFGHYAWPIAIALLIVAIGSALTILRRTLHLTSELEAR